MKWKDESRNDRRNNYNQRQGESYERHDKDYYRSFDRRQSNDKMEVSYNLYFYFSNT